MLEFNYEFGSYFGGMWIYHIKGENGVYNFTALGRNGVKLNLNLVLTEKDIQPLMDIIRRNSLFTWNEFSGNNNNILDGYSFTLKYSYKEESIVASGYEEYPKNYKKVEQELKEYFSQFVK